MYINIGLYLTPMTSGDASGVDGGGSARGGGAAQAARQYDLTVHHAAADTERVDGR